MDSEILLTLILLATFGRQIAGKLIVQPQDTDVKVNHSTYFNCSTDHGSTETFWFHGTKHVYTGNAILEPYHERFRVDRDVWNGTYIYNLVIHSVQPGDAGKYICAEDEGVGEQYSVQLVVLENEPTCRSNIELDEVVGQNTCNIEPDEVELQCSVTYHGNIPPQLEWKKVGENSSTSLDEASVVTSRNHFVSTLKLKGDIALNNSSHGCETKRTTQEPIKCISQVIKILYALDGNSTVNRTINDEIQCYGNTSQSCNYKWRWLQDFTIESSTFILKARKPGWHRCEAECYLRNETCNLLVMRALVSGDKESSQTRNIIIAVVVTVVVTLVTAFVVVIVAAWISSVKGSTTEERKRKRHEPYEEVFMPLSERRKETSPEICGLAILDQEVFISRRRHPDIEVYDATKFQFKLQITVEGMKDPEHIVSCIINNCLYAVDWCYQDQDPALLRINPNNGSLIKTWDIYGKRGLLSVASDTNVILNVNFEDKLHF